MPYAIRWEPPSGVVLKLSGTINNLELRDAIHGIHASPNFDGLRYVIHDLSRLESFEVDEAVIEAVFASSIGAGIVNPNRHIYVATTNEVVLGHLSRLAETYEDALPISIHATLAEATMAKDADMKTSPPRQYTRPYL